MKRVSPGQRAEWAKRLEASGFVDLEGPGGVLSNRGMPSTTGRHMAPEDRADEEAYYDDARAALHCYRFATRQDRVIWALYVERVKYTDIGAHVGLSFTKTREAIIRIRAAIYREARQDVNSVNPVRVSARDKVDRLVRSMDLDLLLAMAGRLN